MNERIKQLAKQAGYITEADWEGMIHFDMEKFAQLIVRECMKESMDEIVPEDEIAKEKDPLIREYLKGNNQGIIDAVIRFRNSFGVEE